MTPSTPAAAQGSHAPADETEPTDPKGWTLLYRVTMPNGDQTPEIPVQDCFDINDAYRSIATWVGVSQGTYTVRPPVGHSKSLRYFEPVAISPDGTPIKCKRHGRFQITPAYVLATLGFDHVPGGARTNLAHREGAPEPDSSSSSGVDEQLGRLRHELSELRRQLERPQQPAQSSFAAEMEKLRLQAEISRQERLARREEERDEEERARAKRRQEAEEEDRKEKLKLDRELAKRRQEAEEERAKDEAAFERKMRMQREENQHSLRVAELETKKGGMGDGLGARLLSEFMDRLEDGGGLISALLGNKDKDDDDSAVGQVERAMKVAKEAMSLVRTATPAAPVPPQPQPPQPQPPQPQLPAPAPVPAASRGVVDEVHARPVVAPDSADYPAMPLEDGRVLVESPAGLHWRRPGGLSALTAAELAEARAMLSAPPTPPAGPPKTPKTPKTPDPGGDDDPDDEDPDAGLDDMQKIAFAKLRKKAPALEEIVIVLADAIDTQALAGEYSPKQLAIIVMKAFAEDLSPAEQASAREQIAKIDRQDLLDNFEYFMPSGSRHHCSSEPFRACLSAAFDAVRQQLATS